MRRQITELCSIVKSECDFLDLGIENNKIKLDYTSSFTMLLFFFFLLFTMLFVLFHSLWSSVLAHYSDACPIMLLNGH